MVSVVSVEELLLGDVKKMLLRELKDLSGKGNIEEAFAAWLLDDCGVLFYLNESARKVSQHLGAQRQYKDVAILGFAAASNHLEPTNQDVLKEGLSWIVGREPLLNGQPQGFCTDALALLGIALGARALGNDAITAQLREWFNKFVSQSFQSRLDDWQKCLLNAACEIGGASVSSSMPNTNDLADVRVALYSKGVFKCDVISQEQDQIKTLSLMKLGCNNAMPSGRAALRLAAFESIQKIPSTANLAKPSMEDVSRILNHVPAAFRRWTWEHKARTRGAEARQWHIDNEYHVQSFLYFLLLPIFPDLKDEDYTPSIGQMHPRADLLVPSMKLIIEVKFMRATDKPQDMIEQIAADSSLYLVAGSKYTQIAAFIWDDSCRSQEHDCMRKGIKQLRGIIDAVIISRPGNLKVSV